MNINKQAQRGHADNAFPFSLIFFMLMGWWVWSISNTYFEHKYHYSKKIYQVLDIERLDLPQDLKINAFRKIAQEDQFQENGNTATIIFSLNQSQCENTLNALFPYKKNFPVDLIINHHELVFKEALNDTQIMAICNHENTFTQTIHLDNSSTHNTMSKNKKQ